MSDNSNKSISGWHFFGLLVVLIIVIILGFYLSKVVDNTILGVMIAIVAIITFFGIFMLPGRSEESTIKNSRIRFAIAASLVVVYLIYVGIVIFMPGSLTGVAKELFPTITTLLAVVVPFYFGAEVVVKVDEARRKAKRENLLIKKLSELSVKEREQFVENLIKARESKKSK